MSSTLALLFHGLVICAAGLSMQPKKSPHNLSLEIPSDYYHNVICWNGAGLEMKNKVSGSSNQDTNIVVKGHGCEKCSVGSTCSFLVEFRSMSTYFNLTQYDIPDIFVNISGRALISADVQYNPGSILLGNSAQGTFRVTYSPILPGQYRVFIESVCNRNNEDLIEGYGLAQFKLDVEEPQFPVEISSPCRDRGQYGHWFLEDQATEYTFKDFDCATNLDGYHSFLDSMERKNISIISFVGDSHLRGTIQHMEYLLKGKLTCHRAAHWNCNWKIKTKNGHIIQVHFVWMGGIYVGGECHRRPKWKYPQYDSRSDIVIISAASWTFYKCPVPLLVFPHRLAPLLNYFVNEIPHQPHTQFFWRSAPPIVTHRFSKCPNMATHRLNSNLKWANDVARTLSAAFGIQYLDLWDVENPLREMTCTSSNIHYSCNPNIQHMKGIVGEATTKVLMHVIAQ